MVLFAASMAACTFTVDYILPNGSVVNVQTDGKTAAVGFRDIRGVGVSAVTKLPKKKGFAK